MNKQTMLDAIRNNKQAIPVLTFPMVQKMGITVRELISDPDIQAKALVELSKTVPMGAIVGLMDLSVEAEAFGAVIRAFDMDVPTVIGRTIESLEDLDQLEIPPVEGNRVEKYVEAIRKTKQALSGKIVLAGCIGPYSLAGRLFDMTELMIASYEEPELVDKLLEMVSTFLIRYIQAYKEVGADGIFMAEPTAGLLSPDLCDRYSSKYIKMINKAVQDDSFIFAYHNCGNTIPLLESIQGIGADIYHFGNAVDMIQVLEKMTFLKCNALLMGNVDPVVYFRNGTKESMELATINLLESCSAYNQFIISSGCDIPPLSPWENIEIFFETVEQYRKKTNKHQ